MDDDETSPPETLPLEDAVEVAVEPPPPDDVPQ